MTASWSTPEHGSAQLSAHLVDEYAGVLRRPVVEAEVAAAARELRGQVPPGSLAEMLHRLVAYRLLERVEP